MKNQSARMNRYLQIAETLIKENQVYACICSRKDIASAPQEGIVNHSICPGKCSTKDVSIHKENVSWRLQNQQNPVLDGLILRNRDKVFSFEFTSTVDDYDDGITHIIRGLDLLPAEERLNELRSFMFPLSPPLQFFYHPLLFESSLQKVSKSKGAKSLRAMLTSGWNLDSLTGYCAFLLGKSTALQPKDLNWWQANAVEMLVR
jgi:glutamyl/glutaminyl-tRNA synthetase